MMMTARRVAWLVLLLPVSTSTAFSAALSSWSPSLRTKSRLASQQVASVESEMLERQEALYDLVYVERLAPPEQTSGGLFLVAAEDPPMHLAKVISVGSGLEGENGRVTENSGVKPGDYVYLKWPWGIGPKDEQCGEEGNVRRFSFVKYQDIAAVATASD